MVQVQFEFFGYPIIPDLSSIFFGDSIIPGLVISPPHPIKYKNKHLNIKIISFITCKKIHFKIKGYS